MSVPAQLASAYLEITTKGLDKAKKDLASLKSSLLSIPTAKPNIEVPKSSGVFDKLKSGTLATIEGFNKVKASITGALDRATDIPVLKQLKTGISYVNTKFDEFLTKRYGKLAKPIKYSGMAVDLGMMAAGYPIPGGAILGTLPAMAGAEGYKQVKDYMGRRRERQATGQAPTLLDKGVNAVGAGASKTFGFAGAAIGKGIGLAGSAVGGLVNKVRNVNFAPLVSGMKSVGSAALTGFGAAGTAVGGFLGKLNGDTLSAFGGKLKELGTAVSASISEVTSVGARGFAFLTAGIGAAVRMADPYGWLQFTTAIQGVSIQIGRIFVPLLREVTYYVIRLEQFMRGLTDETRASILQWVRVALVVTGVITALGTLFSILTAGFGILSSFVGILSALGVSGPIGWIIAIGAAIAGLVAIVAASTGGLAGLFGGLQPLLAGLIAAFRNVLGAIMPILQQALGFFTTYMQTALGLIVPFVTRFATLFANSVGQVAGVIGPIAAQIFASLTSMMNVVRPVAERVLNGVMGVASAVFAVIVRGYSAILPIIGGIIQSLIPLFQRIYEAFYGMIARVLPIISRLVTGIGSVLIPTMTAIYNTIRTVVAAVVPIISDFIDALTPIYEAIVDVFSSIIDACEPLFGMFGEGAGIFETLLGVVVNMVLAPLRALAFVLSIVTPVIRFFATAISEIAAFISGVLRPVFDAMAAMMHDLNVGFRRLINGLIDCVNMLIDFYNTLPIPGRLQRMSRIAEAPAAPAPNAAPNQQQQQQGNRPPNFQGEVRQQMQLVGIAEAWRRAQTADPNDPSLRLQQQQLNQAQESNGVLNDILNWLRSNGGNQAVFGS